MLMLGAGSVLVLMLLPVLMLVLVLVLVLVSMLMLIKVVEFALEVGHVPGFWGQQAGYLVVVVVVVVGRDEPIVALGVAVHPPVVVVHQKMVVSTERDRVGNIGVTAMFEPFVAMMAFGPGDGCVAARRGAATPFHRQGRALRLGEQALGAPQIQGQQVLIEEQ